MGKKRKKRERLARLERLGRLSDEELDQHALVVVAYVIAVATWLRRSRPLIWEALNRLRESKPRKARAIMEAAEILYDEEFPDKSKRVLLDEFWERI